MVHPATAHRGEEILTPYTEEMEQARQRTRAALQRFEKRTRGAEVVYVAVETDFDELRQAVSDVVRLSAE